MNDFKRNRSDRPSRPFEKRYQSGGQSSGPREMYSAECSKCNEHCQVPFRPNGKKPVYCANCFTRPEGNDSYDSKRGSSPRPMRSSAPQASDPQLFELKKQISALTATVEKLVVSISEMNRASALSKEVRKHMPADKPAPAPAKVERKAASSKKAAPKKSARKSAK